MADTTQTPVEPEVKTKFNGRDFVPADEPSGESPFPADGNDDGGGVSADEDVPSGTPSNEAGGANDEPAGEAGADGGQPKKTFWDQTPEEKRAERFNHSMERQNALAKELDEYKAKVAKYEAGEGPKPAEPAAAVAEAEPEAEQTVEAIIGAAIDPEAKVEALTENQKRIRGFSLEVAELRKSLVLPARETFEKASTELGKATEALTKRQNRLEHLKEMSEGQEGLYDTEISATEEQIRRLELAVTRAKSDHVNARLDLRDADEKVALRKETNLTKARTLAAQDGRRHQETASQKQYDSDYKSEEARLAEVWDADLKSVIAELKIPEEDKADAADLAFTRVKAIGDQRGEKNPVTEAEFKGLIKQALSRMATRATSAAGRSEAEIAEEREKATAQPAPKKRTAGSNSDAPPSVEEARRELKSAFESRRVRVRAA